MPAALPTEDGVLPVEVADATADGIRLRVLGKAVPPLDAIVALVLRGRLV